MGIKNNNEKKSDANNKERAKGLNGNQKTTEVDWSDLVDPNAKPISEEIAKEEKITEKDNSNKIDPLVEENEILKDHLLRSQADFDNYIKRTEKDKIYLKNYHTIKVLEKILPIIDSIEQALKNSPDDKGIKTLFDQTNSVLVSLNVRPIEVIGKKFDVAYHEVLMEQHDDRPEGTVIAEIQKGYFIGENILRHSKVIISKGKSL